MNTFTDTHAILTAFFDALPWPVLMLDDRGHVTFINREMRRARNARVAGADTRLAALYPEYRAALHGEPPWLTAQTATVSRVAQRRDGDRTHIRCIACPSARASSPSRSRSPPADWATRSLHALLRWASWSRASVMNLRIRSPRSIRPCNCCAQVPRARPPCWKKVLPTIAANVQRMLNISRKLNDFSRASDDARTLLNLRATVNDAVVAVAPRQHYAGGRRRLQHRRGHCRARRPRPVATGVLQCVHECGAGHGRPRTAFLSAPRGPRRTVSKSRSATPDRASPKRDLARLFEPFFTTKPAGQGTGLGLAISNEIVLSHGGSMRAANDARGGACFYIRLPAVS